MRFVWSGRVASLALVFAAACGGKAEKDGPIADAPRAGASGATTASGGAGGESPAETSGGAFATGGVVAAGGAVSAGGAGGISATGGVAPLEPGTELWLPRGYTVLESEFYDQLLSDVFEVPPAEFMKITPWAPGGQDLVLTPTVPPEAERALKATAEQFLDRLSDAQLLGPLGCGDGQDEPMPDENCARAVSTGFARRMWRREVSSGEVLELMALFGDARPGAGAEGLRRMVRAILIHQDAYALPTLGDDSAGDDESRLTDLELAGLLAVGITGMPPDDELLEAALTGTFESEIERTLGSDGARKRVAALIRDWFGIARREQLWLFSDQAELTASMYEETQRFIESVVFDEPEPVSTLVTADFSFIDSSLAQLYGLDARKGADYERVDLGDTRRRGIPGQASYLVSTSDEREPSYGLRGTYPLRLICETLPPTPVIDFGPLPPVEAARRERYEAGTAGALCDGCHHVMNPVAFAFDHFDEAGRYVEADDESFPIDSSGALTTLGGIPFEFADSAELTQKMSERPEYSACFVRNAAAFLTGVPHFDPALVDYVTRKSEHGDERAADEEVLTLIRTFVSSRYFRYRKL